MKINYLTPNWSAPKNIHALMTLRYDGYSQGLFSGLNLAAHVEDDLQTVEQNRQLLVQQLSLPSEPVWLNQSHSTRVIVANTNTLDRNADASFTTQSGVVCAVLTADCLPLLICTEDGEQVAAIHAGWRGLLDGIITETVKALQTQRLLVWLGAAIAKECFIVGDEVRDAFIQRYPNFAAGFQPIIKNNQQQWLADIYQLSRIELRELGVENISGGEYCTVCDQQRFYSFRRDQITGRMASLIWKA